VMKMVGIFRPASAIRFCRSSPLMPGRKNGCGKSWVAPHLLALCAMAEPQNAIQIPTCEILRERLP
jgi:hypothetical protein